MSAKHIIIVACGTSWHAALIGKQLIEKMCRKRVEVEYASEFRYGEPVIESDDVVIAISQSGETADTLAAIQLAKQHGALIFGIVNGVGSSIARETDTGIYIHVGPEIGVASTKAFTGQVTVLTLFALALGHELGTLSEKDYVETIAELAEIPGKMEKVLEQTPSISRLAKVFTYAHNFLYLGRGFNYPVALEGALKLKEISYIHAEGYPAAEMKHGPIALVDTDMPIVFLATHHQLYEKIISNMQEVKSRNGRILAIVTEGDKQVKAIADSVIEVPQTLNALVPLLSVVPLQILAYYVAVDKGLNVDMPRNLAKSVTVEYNISINKNMSDETKNNSRIAKNTLYLYLRMFISLALSLVTGRVVLRTLGVDDYGINAVVGGVIGMFGVIQVCMIGATSRFITFELGRGDAKRLKDTFSTTLTIHIIIALILFIILETIGLWMVNYKLVIPEGRMFAANCVYQFSIISLMFGVTQTPYSSAIVAHEKMDVYAYFDILSTVLKLVIIYLLLIGNMDKLILYGILTLCVSTLIMVLNRIYCVRHFPETRYHFIWDKSLLKPIFAFSGWDILGNVAVMARGEGVTLLINMFFGTALNAAAGIANTVTNAVGGFSSNIIMAVKPQIIKRYADGEYEAMIKLTHEGTVLCFILMTCLSIPLMAEIHFVLNLWLGIVPAYACVFTNLILLFGIIGCMGSIVMNIVHATGKIKKTSLTNGCIYIMVLPITYIAYKRGAPAWVPFAYNALGLFIGTMCNIYYMTTYVPHLNAIGYFKQTVLPCFALFIAVGIPVALLHYYMEEGWLRLLVSILLTVVLTGLISYKFMIDKELREKVVMKVKEKFINRR